MSDVNLDGLRDTAGVRSEFIHSTGEAACLDCDYTDQTVFSFDGIEASTNAFNLRVRRHVHSQRHTVAMQKNRHTLLARHG